MGQPDQQKTAKHHAGGRCQVLRGPGHLEQPAAQTRRLAHESIGNVGRCPLQQGADRGGRGQHDDDESSRHLAGEPGSEANHRQKRSKGGEPDERRIGLPSARSRHDGNDGGAEMPEVIVGDAVRHAGFAEERILRRNARADHLVDQCDLGMIEDGGGQRHALGRDLRQHRGCRRERQQGSGQHDGCNRQERPAPGNRRPLQEAG